MNLGTAILKTYRNRLTNLTGRNRSLVLTTLPAEQFLDLHDADFLLNRPSFDLIAHLLSRKPAIPLCDVMDARNERVNEVSRRLRRIVRTAQFIEAERGTDDLYVGWPFVRGKFMDGTVVHGPLLFFPVMLSQTGNRWQLTRRGEERGDSAAIVLNTSFALAYSHFNQVKIGEDTLEKEFADFDKDALIFRTQLYEWLKTTPFEVNANSDLFADQLQPFDRQTAKRLGELERTGELKLYSEAVLGIFPQAGSFLVPDYDTLIERAGSATDRFSVDAADGPSLPAHHPTRPIREEHLHTPLPLDASQEAAVRIVKAGESIVVQGPPGTGKSQLIANLMADAAADGKRVLLVCQKRAALDVVYTRLREVGMAPFVALIHDFQNDRAALYGQIAGQIADVDTYRTQNYSLDAVLLERSFDTESRRIDDLIGELQAFRDALFDVTDCGVSVKELYLSAVPPDGSTTDTPVDLSDVYVPFRFDKIDSFLRKLTDYAAYLQRLGPAHPFAKRVSFSPFGASALPAAERTLATIPETARLVLAAIASLFSQPLTLIALTTWHEHTWALTALLTLTEGPDAETRWQLARLLLANPAHPARTVAETELTRLADSWETTLSVPGPESTLLPTELLAFRAILASALAARRSWAGWTWWQLTHSGKPELMRVLAANALSTSEVDLQTLALRVEKRSQLDEIQRQTAPLLSLSTLLPNVPAGLRLLRQARDMAERLSDLGPVLTFLPAVWETVDAFAAAVRTTLTQAECVQSQRPGWQTYLTGAQIEHVWIEPAHAQTLRQALRTDFEVLVEADRLNDSFSATEATVIARLTNLPPDRWVQVFQTALCRHWIEHIEQKHPILRSVSSLKMEQMERALQDSMAQKQHLSRAILLVKLREQTYQNLTVNRLNNLVSYRELQHQTTKKRSVWPVRKLMSQFADEVFKLVPCWLASPESVSAMFPLSEGLFDLVIFDEASQCFAESGLPAMARGKQVVVAGDSQQLRPSDLYRIRIDTDLAGEPDGEAIPADHAVQLEVESLLELAAQTLPQVSLTGHYRSRSAELIEFSNRHFYGNKLTLLPDFSNLSQAAEGPAIRYQNVAGVWQQHTNPVEADAVITLIGELATELPGMSIGVVTFNYQQQQLIQEKLENRPEQPRSGLDSGEVTFVKNIENVQGDERDIIIFSVGYAPDERGRLTMQFGSLTGSGGENRLNVAVTRARERIYVVTSLWPDQLNVEQSVNAGPKVLKAYLRYALDVAEGNFRPQPRPVAGIRSSALLKTRLTGRHPDWQPALPFAD
ncbi:MAG: DUF4011 domain-containing protein, partial [Bacteroidetes bacterium]|nr:DUF4011 domain-containing protein [Fibrella sp.]